MQSTKELTKLRNITPDDIISIIIHKIDQRTAHNTIIRYKLLNMLQSKKNIINPDNIRQLLLNWSIDIDSNLLSSINIDDLIKDLR